MKTEVELKKIAKEIATLEIKIMKTSDKEKKKNLENKMMKKISNYNLGIFDMLDIDEMVQDMLQ